MALIKCRECGKEISDKAQACIHCGCPTIVSNGTEGQARETEPMESNVPDESKPSSANAIRSELENAELSPEPYAETSSKKARKTTLPPKAVTACCIAIAVAAVLLIALIANGSCGAANQQGAKSPSDNSSTTSKTSSDDEVLPYLAYLGTTLPEGKTLTIDGDLSADIENVNLMGVKGAVNYSRQIKTEEIYVAEWSSFDDVTKEEYDAFAEKLDKHLGNTATIKQKTFVEGRRNYYRWSDNRSNPCLVECSHDISTKSLKGAIVVRWELNPYAVIPDSVMDFDAKTSLRYLRWTFGQSGFDREDSIYSEGSSFKLDEGKFLGRACPITVHYGEGDGSSAYISVQWTGDDTLVEIGARITQALGCDYDETSRNRFKIHVPGTDLNMIATSKDDGSVSSILIATDAYIADLEKSDSGAATEAPNSVPDIKHISSLPEGLMNETFRNALGLFGKTFAESGLDASDGIDTDSGTRIFYFDGCEFLGKPCDDTHGKPRIVYESQAVESGDGYPSHIFFSYANALKGNGHKETMDIVNGIADQLGIEGSIEISNDYDSDSRMAIGSYCTIAFPDISLEMEVTNTDGTVEIEIRPIAASE